MKKKRKKSRKLRKINWKKLSKWQIGILCTACIMAISVVASVYMTMGKYDGLGLKMPVDENVFDMARIYYEDGRAGYEDEQYGAVTGIDVSEFQGEIDWKAVKADGVDFAIVRVGGRFMQSGKLYDDSYFERNVEGALAAGLQVGVYFFSQAISPEEGVEEAEYILSRIEGYDITMPIVMDWEHLNGSDSRVYGVEPERVTAAIRAFSDRIREAGYEPMVYMNSYCGYIKMDLRELNDVGFWFAQYTPVPVFRYHFDMWQYTDQGQVDGITGNVDRNLYFQK